MYMTSLDQVAFDHAFVVVDTNYPLLVNKYFFLPEQEEESEPTNTYVVRDADDNEVTLSKDIKVVHD